MELPNKKYQVIYADPPWKYNAKSMDGTKNHDSCSAIDNYNTMTVEELLSLDIPSICDSNCFLLMWATFPKLKEAIRVLEGWGFKYITTVFAWVKITKDGRVRPDGLGRYTPNNIELVLLGRKGRYWRASKKVKQVIMAQKRKHSEKPEETYSRIERLFGDVPRIELFARHRREGWDAWGNEVPAETQYKQTDEAKP